MFVELLKVLRSAATKQGFRREAGFRRLTNEKMKENKDDSDSGVAKGIVLIICVKINI